jgi:predicted nucleic acid-binding protein
MSDKIFLDTNIIIYLYSEDELVKNKQSESILQSENITISTQVLNEFSNTLRKKFKLGFDEIGKAIKQLIENISVIPIRTQTIFSALNTAKKYRFSYYDSLIIASAIEYNCDILYSEDLQHGQIIEKKLKIINPYLLQSSLDA